MGTVLLWWCAAAVLVLGAPAVLRRAVWTTRAPRSALGLWCAVFVGGLFCALVGLGHCVLLATGRASGPAGGSVAEVTAGWCSLAVLGAAGSLLATRWQPLALERRTTGALLRMLISSAGYRQQVRDGVEITFVDGERPMVLSLPGRPPRVLLTSRVEDELSPAALEAVVEHERAHLGQRHHWVTALTALNAACLPALLGAREFDRAARLLTELIADDCAKRRCGTGPLREALDTLGRLTEDPTLQLRAQRLAGRQPADGLDRVGAGHPDTAPAPSAPPLRAPERIG